MRKSKFRRDNIFAAGRAAGIAEGTELGQALGLAEGIERGKESVARENASLKATNEALHKRLCESLKQSNGIATENLLATRTAADLVVKKQQLRNQIAVLERTVADQTVELETLKQLTGLQVTKLDALRSASSIYLGFGGSTPASASRPTSSPYLKNPTPYASQQLQGGNVTPRRLGQRPQPDVVLHIQPEGSIIRVTSPQRFAISNSENDSSFNYQFLQQLLQRRIRRRWVSRH